MIRAAPAALVLALVALVWALLHAAWYPHAQIVDYAVYHRYGDHVVHADALPYRDFRLEYPPGALPVFILPSLLGGLGYNGVFQVLMAISDAALALAVLAIGGLRAAAFAAVAPLLLGSVVVSRFDLWPAALTVCALATLLRGRHAVSAVLFATAFAAKLWPAVLLPILVIWLWRRRGRGDALSWLAAAAVTAAAWFVPFTALSPAGVGHSFHEQLARPLQIESLGASILAAVHQVAPTTLGIVTSFGSQNVGGTGVHAVELATTVAEVAAVLAVWAVFARGEPTTDRLLLSSAAAVAAVVAFGKVFSPQFLIWLIPLVPLVRRTAAWVPFALALVLTQAYFPKRYWEYARTFYGAETAVVLARNLVVVALFALLVYASHRSTAASSAVRSSSVSIRSGARTSG